MRQGGICLEQKDIETALWREDREGKHFMSRVKCASGCKWVDRFLHWTPQRLPVVIHMQNCAELLSKSSAHQKQPGRIFHSQIS